MSIHLNQGHIAAVVLVLALIVWMFSGSMKEEETFSNPRPLSMESGLTRVQVKRMKGESAHRDIVISARTAANRRVNIKAEMTSTVTQILKSQGEFVKAGDIIMKLDARAGPATMKQAKASLKQSRIQLKSAQQLFDKGLANEAQVIEAETKLANAEAEYIRANVMVKSAVIRAPFAGIVDQRSVETGDFVREGTPLVTVMDFSPYLIKGQVAEQEAANINMGDRAYAELVNGDHVEGRVRFIAAEANSQTRTYSIEVEIDNPSGTMTSGLTAKLHVPQPATEAYKISPALLILSDDGKLGLKGIDPEHKVIFRPVNLLKADNDGIWVYGLGKEADIITVGQGFVRYGEQVEPVYLNESESGHNNASGETTPLDDKTALSAG